MDRCRRIAELVSDGLDRRLSASERVRVRLHQMLCTGCRAFERQMRLLREMSRGYAERLDRSSDDSG